MKFFFRLIGPPSDYAFSQVFHLYGKGETIYNKLYKNNMEGLKSFYTNEAGLEYLVSSDSVAFVQDGNEVWSFTNYHCKVWF